MFAKQQLIQEHAQSVRNLLQKYGQDSAWLDTLERDNLTFRVRLPFIGSFSAGKSSLMNALIGENILATDIDPKTTIPAELHYSSEERITAHTGKGETLPIERSALRENDFSHLLPDGWLELALPIPALKDCPHLTLVDMPGWESGNQGHNRAIDTYISRSLAYCIVVNADHGSIHDSMRKNLLELKLYDSPVILVINKADKKTAAELAEVSEFLNTEIQKILGKPPLARIICSARKKQLNELATALALVEQQAESLFSRTLGKDFGQGLKRLQFHLKQLLNEEDLDSAAIATKKATLEADFKQFEAQLAYQTQKTQEQVPSIVSRVREKIRSHLYDQLEPICNAIRFNESYNGLVAEAVRAGISEGFRDTVVPELQRYQTGLAESLPTSLHLDLNRNTHDSSSEHEGSKLKDLLNTLLPTIITKFPPIQILAAALTALVNLFDNSRGNRQTIETTQQKEQIREQLLNRSFPDILAKYHPILEQEIRNKIQALAQEMQQSVQKNRDQYRHALTELAQQLEQGKATFAQKQKQFQVDHNDITTLLQQLEAS